MITGGTIDSFYDGMKDTAVPNEHSIIPRYIKGLKFYNQTEFTEICIKDIELALKIIIVLPKTLAYFRPEMKANDYKLLRGLIN